MTNVTTNKHFNFYKNELDLEFLRHYYIEHGKIRLMKRGEIFEEVGKPSQYVAYVGSGCFRYMVHNNIEDKDYCTGFAFKGEFVANYPNCLSGKKSEITIVAGTSCKLFQISGKELDKLLNSVDTEIKQSISDSLFNQVYTQYLDNYRITTRDRYKRLLLRCPELFQSINLKDIASYLKVTPTTISKIRREITFGE